VICSKSGKEVSGDFLTKYSNIFERGQNDRGDCPGVLSEYAARNYIKRQKKTARIVFGYHQ